MPKRFSRGWLVACVLACINAHPARNGKKVGGYASNLQMEDRAMKDYDFDDFPGSRYLDRSDETSSLEESEYDEVASTTVRSGFVVLPQVAEPDAEMLPAHYTGVQPPGVDHMEMNFYDSSGLSSNRESIVTDGTKIVDSKLIAGVGVTSVKDASRGGESIEGAQSKDVYENGEKLKSIRENQKSEYAVAAGKKKAHQESEKSFDGHEDETSGEKRVESKDEDHRNKAQEAAGYHNVYHKDEYKKDADFYDNGHEGGRFKKHGRYNEKYVSTESDYFKGNNGASDFTEVEADKRGNIEVARADEESKGHLAKSGHDGYYGKFDEFKKAKGPVTVQLVPNNKETAVKVQ